MFRTFKHVHCFLTIAFKRQNLNLKSQEAMYRGHNIIISQSILMKIIPGSRSWEAVEFKENFSRISSGFLNLLLE